MKALNRFRIYFIVSLSLSRAKYLSNEWHFDGNYGLTRFIQFAILFEAIIAVHSICHSFLGNYKTIIAIKMQFNTYIYIYLQQILVRYCVV